MKLRSPSGQSVQDSLQSSAASTSGLLLQRQEQAAFADSPRQSAQQQTQDWLQNASRQTAQRQRLDTLQRVSSEAASTKAAPAGGLPETLKSGIESLSGMSMDAVRVHYNSAKPAQLNALAYAQGTDIHVAPGQEKHLPHEAWHVVQQMQGRVQATRQLREGVPINDQEALEREADVMGAKAKAGMVQKVAGGVSGQVRSTSRMISQRQLMNSRHGQIAQRVLKNTGGGDLKPAGTTAWKTLTTPQKTFARRLMNDPYTEYQFNSSKDFLAYVQDPVGGPQPHSKITKGARQQDAVPDNPGDSMFGAYTPAGRGKNIEGSATHKSNWAHYVMGQFAAARQAIAVHVTNHIDQVLASTAIEAHCDEALKLADRLDSQEVDTTTPLVDQPIPNGHAMALVEPPVHRVDVNTVVKSTPGQWVQKLKIQSAYNWTTNQVESQWVPHYEYEQVHNDHTQQWEWQLAPQYEYQQPQQYTEQESTNVYGDELYSELVEPVLLQQKLIDLWNVVVQASGQPAQFFPQAAVPKWGSMKADGIGTWVIAEYTPDSSWAVGSDSDTSAAPSPWNVGNLGHRKTMDRADRYYIQGHLLNDNMGGPGLAYNMTPLSGEISASSINANQGHLHVIEGQAKAALKEMVADRNASASPRPNPIASIRYAVLGSWRGHGSREVIADRAEKAAAQLQNIKLYLPSLGVVNPGDLSIQQLHHDLMNDTWAVPGDTTKPLWNDPTTGIKSFVDAVVPIANRGGKSIDATIPLMTSNAALWAYENANVPSHLDYRLTTVRRNGDVNSHRGTLANKISDAPELPYG